MFFCFQASAQVQWNLVWSDEFTGLTNTAPDSTKWGYDGPNAGSGNSELETYCGQAGAGQSGDCTNWLQNAHHDGQGNLIISAVQKSGKWTSARLITHQKGLGFSYGRAEARMKLPVGNGLWPAFWMLGDNIDSVNWPACGEADMMENVTFLGAGAIRSTVHGPGYSTNSPLHRDFTFPSGGRVDTAYHVYGVIWTTNSIQYYVDDYTKPFAVFTPAMMPQGGVWPFNDHSFFLILNLAVGGTWPGNPDTSTPNPANMYVDYVRVYKPAPPPYLVEAEYASASGGIASNSWAGYSATGYRSFFVNSSGEYIEWKTYSPFAGLQPLQFRYANGAASAPRMELKLNGAVIASSLGFPSTGSWANWSTVTSTARLIPGTNSIRLTTTGMSGPNIDYLLVGSGSNPPPGLALRLPLDDAPGTTTSLSDTNRGAADIRVQMFDLNNMPADFHGAPGSGVSGTGSALDFSSDRDGGLGFNLPGAVARATNQLNLGFQTVTSFVASVWFKLDSMFTNNVNRGGRVFILGTNGIADQGTNSLSLSFFSQNQLQYKINSNTVAAVFPGNVPTNTWLFYAIVYDGSTANVFSGTETSPAVLVNTTNNLNGLQSINFGSSGALFLGNRLNLDRALDGWIQDFRFYTFSRSSSFVEDIRWSAMAPTGLAASLGPNGVTLTWNPVPGAASYNVFRSTNSGSAYTILASGITGTSYIDSTAAPGTSYFYVVSAVDASGAATSSQISNEAAVTASAPALTILYTGTNSTLSWPSSAAGFNLYGASNLTPPAVWSRITAPVMNQGGTFSVSVPVNGTQFFRLSMP